MKIKLSSEEAQLLLDLAHERHRILMKEALRSNKQEPLDQEKQRKLLDALIPKLAGNAT